MAKYIQRVPFWLEQGCQKSPVSRRVRPEKKEMEQQNLMHKERKTNSKNAKTKRKRRLCSIEINSVLCRDAWSKIIEFCDTREWLQLSYTCKGINQFKFNRLFMSNKRRTLLRELSPKRIGYWFRLNRGTLFNVGVNWHPDVTDEHFQFLKGIHTLYMYGCSRITDNAFVI